MIKKSVLRENKDVDVISNSSSPLQLIEVNMNDSTQQDIVERLGSLRVECINLSSSPVEREFKFLKQSDLESDEFDKELEQEADGDTAELISDDGLNQSDRKGLRVYQNYQHFTNIESLDQNHLKQLKGRAMKSN